jgi:outer membrane protein, adhesin transport system
MKSVLFSYAVAAMLVAWGAQNAQADTLKATVEKALASNPEVLGAVANRNATEQELEGAKGALYPSADLRAGKGKEWTDSATTPASGINLTRKETGLTLRQTIYDGGAANAEIARQSARLQSLDSKVFDVSDTIAQRTADIYLETLKATRLYFLAKANLAAHQKYLDKIRDRVDAGVGQRADLQLAEGRLALANATLTSREAALDDDRIRYRRLVGEKPADLQKPDSISRTIPALLELAEEIAIANNASLKVAKAEVVAAKEAETAARTRNMPVVSLDAGLTRNNNIDGTQGTHSNNSLMLVLNYNLFRGGSDRAKIAELAARVISAAEAENNVRRTIDEETGRAWIALNAAKASLDFLNNHAVYTAEVKEAYQSQFDVGKRSLLDLMNSENELFQANTNYISGLYSVTQSEYRLLAVMGGLLKILGAL